MKNMVLKNFELYNLLEGIKFNSVYEDGKFQVILMKDDELIIDELKKMEIIKKFDEGYEKFKDELDELLKEFAKKDEKGNPITIKNENPNTIEYEIPKEKHDSLIKKRKTLVKKHQEAIDNQEKKEKEFVKLMNEDCDLDFYMITESRIPEKMNGEHLRSIHPLIDYRKKK